MPFRKYGYYLASVWKLLSGMKPWPRIVQVFLRTAPPGPFPITLRQSGLKFVTRGVMDIWSVKETFLDRFYERYGTPVGSGWTVVDIGGGIGDFTIFAAQAHPSNRVFAFEPTPQSYQLLQENLRLNGVRNAQAFPEAVWSENGSLTIDTTVGEPAQFTSHREGASQAATNGKVRVPSRSLEDAFTTLGIERCDLLKLDCEGAEYAILFNTPASILQRIDRMVMEYHDGVTEYSHADLAQFLRQQGFQVETFTNVVHDDLGYLRAWRG